MPELRLDARKLIGSCAAWDESVFEPKVLAAAVSSSATAEMCSSSVLADEKRMRRDEFFRNPLGPKQFVLLSACIFDREVVVFLAVSAFSKNCS